MSCSNGRWFVFLTNESSRGGKEEEELSVNTQSLFQFSNRSEGIIRYEQSFKRNVTIMNGNYIQKIGDNKGIAILILKD